MKGVIGTAAGNNNFFELLATQNALDYLREEMKEEMFRILLQD